MNEGRPWSYDRAVTHGFFRDTRPDDGPIIDRYSALAMLAGVCVVAAGSLAWRAPFPIRLAAVIGMLAATLILLLRAFLSSYLALMIRAHLKVVDHPELGDVRRWAIFSTALAGYPLLLLALLLGGVAAAQTLTI